MNADGGENLLHCPDGLASPIQDPPVDEALDLSALNIEPCGQDLGEALWCERLMMPPTVKNLTAAGADHLLIDETFGVWHGPDQLPVAGKDTRDLGKRSGELFWREVLEDFRTKHDIEEVRRVWQRLDAADASVYSQRRAAIDRLAGGVKRMDIPAAALSELL